MDEKTEVVYLIARFPDGEASPEALLSANRGHWGIEITVATAAIDRGERRARPGDAAIEEEI
jgi:hypothetical protein